MPTLLGFLWADEYRQEIYAHSFLLNEENSSNPSFYWAFLNTISIYAQPLLFPWAKTKCSSIYAHTLLFPWAKTKCASIYAQQPLQFLNNTKINKKTAPPSGGAAVSDQINLSDTFPEILLILLAPKLYYFCNT